MSERTITVTQVRSAIGGRTQLLYGYWTAILEKAEFKRAIRRPMGDRRHREVHA